MRDYEVIFVPHHDIRRVSEQKSDFLVRGHGNIIDSRLAWTVSFQLLQAGEVLEVHRVLLKDGDLKHGDGVTVFVIDESIQRGLGCGRRVIIGVDQLPDLFALVRAHLEPVVACIWIGFLSGHLQGAAAVPNEEVLWWLA